MPFAIAVLLFAAVMTGPVRAGELPRPAGEVLLTVTGPIEHTNGNGAARFDLAMLREMEARSFTTHTIWTDGARRFTGVPLAVLMDRVGAEADLIQATAINDYGVEIPASDWERGAGPIIAYLIDGAPMSIRTKGPLWLVFPYDSDPLYRSNAIYARSIWQLDEIAVETR